MLRYLGGYLAVVGLFIYQLIREDEQRERAVLAAQSTLCTKLNQRIGDYIVLVLNNGFSKKGYLVSVTSRVAVLDTTKPKRTAFGWVRTDTEFNIVNTETVLLSTVSRVHSLIKHEDLLQYDT